MIDFINPKQTFALCILASFFAISGCSTKSSQKFSQSNEVSISAQTLIKQENSGAYLDAFKEWKGTPYLIGGTTKSGVDCSSFVQSVFYSATNRILPRTTTSQVKVGIKVPYENARTGDLIFFRTSEKTNHVGIYLGENAFMHASTSKGVIISRLDNPYWSSVFWQMRRVD